MHDYEDQFNQIIAGGRVHRQDYECCNYIRFLLSTADFLMKHRATAYDFETWYRWDARYKKNREVTGEEVARAHREACVEEGTMCRFGLMVRLEEGLAWGSCLPTPDALRRVLMTPEEVEAEFKSKPSFYLDGDDSPEGVKKAMEARFPRLTPEVVDALRRGYQKADEYTRQEDERHGVNLSRLFGRK